MKTYFRILAFVKPYKLQVILYTIFAILAVMCLAFSISLLDPVLNLLFTQGEASHSITYPEFSMNFKAKFNNYIVQYLQKGDKKSALLFAISVIVGINLLGNLFRYLSNIFMAVIRTKTLEDLRTFLFNRVNDLQVSYFEGERKGDIMTRMTSDVYELENSVVVTFQSLVRDPVTILFFLGLMVAFSWQLTLFIFIVLPFAAIIISVISRALRKDAYQTQDMLSWIMSIIEEFASGIRIIKAFNAEDYIKRIFGKYNHQYSFYSRKQFYKKGLVPPFSESMGVITIGLILWYGGGLVFDNVIHASGFITFIFYFQQIMSPAKNISNAFANLNRGIASGQRIFSLVDTPVTIKEKEDAIPINDFRSKIEFNNVSFAYTYEKVLKNINLEVRKGEIVALVGPSGSGKTTLAEMIPRFYDPVEGDIYFDDHDLRDYQIKPLRELIGLVTQDPVLFNDTVYNNIAFGMPDAKEEEVVEAAKAANAHDFIMETDEGYQTYIGDRGVLLSGGQRQRLSIARAILKNPPIMILDEATSALDTSSEKMVQEALYRLMQNRTSVIIAHRLSTIKEADRIIVLDKGNIVQEGNHNELINRDGLYKSLYEMQHLGG